mgnify:CR=1 FL=1
MYADRRHRYEHPDQPDARRPARHARAVAGFRVRGDVGSSRGDCEAGYKGAGRKRADGRRSSDRATVRYRGSGTVRRPQEPDGRRRSSLSGARRQPGMGDRLGRRKSVPPRSGFTARSRPDPDHAGTLRGGNPLRFALRRRRRTRRRSRPASSGWTPRVFGTCSPGCPAIQKRGEKKWLVATSTMYRTAKTVTGR